MKRLSLVPIICLALATVSSSKRAPSWIFRANRSACSSIIRLTVACSTASTSSIMFCPKSDRELTAQEKVTGEWDAMAGEWDDMASEYANGFYKLIWETTGLEPDSSNKLGTVLDFGCGTGLLTDKLRMVSSKVVALDASTKMVAVLKEKIKSMEWENVDAAAVVLASITDEKSKKMIEEMEGTLDLIVASSVMSFVPEEDLEATMAALGKMLKPGGLFCHSDWPKSEADNQPEGIMEEEKAAKMYAMGGLKTKSTKLASMTMGNESFEVFLGVAEKV